MPDESLVESDTPRTERTPDSSTTTYSDSNNNDTNRSACATFPEENISDTGEDMTTETLSKGRLKHELRMTRTNLATKTIILENSEKLASAHELELQEEIRTLSRRLALANTRCEAAMVVASQAAEVEKQLNNAVQSKKQRTRELEQLNHELHSVRHFLIQLPVNHLVYKTDGSELNVASFSLLTDLEAVKLQAKPLEELCLLEVAQLTVHRLVTVFSQEISRLHRQQDNAMCSDSPDAVPGYRTSPPKDLHSIVLIMIKSLLKMAPIQDTSSPSCSRKVRFTESKTMEDDPFSKMSQSLQTSPKDVTLELDAANKQIDLLQQDKAYLMDKVHNLTERLSDAERDLAFERQKYSTLDAEMNDLKAQTDQNQFDAAAHLEAYLRKQLDNFTDLTGQELARIRDFAFKLREYEFCYGNLEISVFFSVHAFFHLPTNNKAFHDQLQIKEFELMRDERDKLLRECEALRSKLTSVKDELELAKTKSASWQNDPEILWNGTSVIATGVTLQQNRNQCGLEDTFVMHKRLAQATVDLEALREENRDALIQIQKLNAQLDASKQAFYELRTQSRLDLASLESKLAVTQQKLQTYTEMENGIDEVVEQVAQSVDSSSPTLAWVDRLEHFCVERSGRSATNPSNCIYLPTLAARRLEHCVKLTKQITQLKSECARLATERDASIQEAKLAKVEVEQTRNMISWKAQPADCLVLSLTRTEKQLRDCQAELDKTRTDYAKLQLVREQLQSERDSLAHDLDQVLTRRQVSSA
ncbi:hypothetical protein FBUS_02174 [Fasciolopsis buskii]|uniref:Uncharacterized protein n=1 Tax=Fasciolopsis buskii TaxID=27845 RepID=A0A8E0RQM6_9TREM|nr:hypothetical protein FBUS_02174 [Fasciolopsis buski]